MTRITADIIKKIVINWLAGQIVGGEGSKEVRHQGDLYNFKTIISDEPPILEAAKLLEPGP